jgi:hypothetical protein
MKQRSPHSVKLDILRKAVADQRHLLRECHADLDAANLAVDDLGDSIREAYTKNDEALAKKLRKSQAAAEERAKDAGYRLDAQTVVAERAEHERDRFIAASADGLLKELEPEAREVTQNLRRHAECLVAADKQWHDLQNQVNQLLIAKGLQPVGNAPADHQLASIAKSLEWVLRDGEIVSPLPHFQQYTVRQEDEALKRRLRKERTAA